MSSLSTRYTFVWRGDETVIEQLGEELFKLRYLGEFIGCYATAASARIGFMKHIDPQACEVKPGPGWLPQRFPGRSKDPILDQ